MSNETRTDNNFQSGGTVSNDNFSAGFSTTKKKTMVEGQEEMTTKENPKNLNVLAGFLVSFSRTELGDYWTLHEGNNAIGKSSENTIALAEKHVSDKHANINVSHDVQSSAWKFQLVDLSSTNGTYLNGNRLPIYAGVEIKNTDVIKLGEYTLVLFAADKFVHRLTKSENFQPVDKGGYDSRDYFSSQNDATNAGY